jgi:hypothetical protein
MDFEKLNSTDDKNIKFSPILLKILYFILIFLSKNYYFLVNINFENKNNFLYYIP